MRRRLRILAMALLVPLTLRASGPPMSHVSGQNSPHDAQCFCLNCPGPAQCCCVSAQSPAEAMRLSAACDQPLDGTSPTSAKDCFVPPSPQTFDLYTTESFSLLLQAEAKVRPAFTLPLERPPRMA
ncbi:MAG: hypothetical protein RMK49_10020 [Abditibacteriales bacterium]|nr:hypothetical protein [Abditibacteriales bacterium]